MSVWNKMIGFAREPLIEKAETLSHWYWLLKTQLYYRRFFNEIGARSRIINPLRLKNVEHISIGVKVLIHKQCWLQTQMVSEKSPELFIGDGCVLGNFNHVTCTNSIRFGEKVLTADGVFITDHGHAYDDITRPILEQGIVSGKSVVIGSGSWLGENVAVLSSCIGKNSVIGANSVVLNDIPDYSIAVGAPARVVRRFNVRTRIWDRVSPGDL